MPGLWQPTAERKSFKLSAAGARYAWFSHTHVRQTKGRWGQGEGIDGRLGRPLDLEWYQLQIVSEGLKTNPSQYLTIKRGDDAWDKIGKWVESPKFGTIGGPRAYKEWYLQLPKKQGKSTISSSLGIYFLGYDNEPGAEVYACAADKKQARIVFDQARIMVQKSPRLLDEIEVYRDVLEHKVSGSIFRVLAADADYNEGFNPFAVIIDELHAHKNRDMYDAMTSHLHTGARDDPIAVIITNAGVDEESICYEIYSQAKAVIEGQPDARTDLYAFVPELEESELYDEKKWKKVALASWTNVETMKEAQRKFPAYVFERRYLNRWTEAEDSWIEWPVWEDAGDTGVTVPKGIPLVVGVDLGMTKDTTAVGWAGVDNVCECGAIDTDDANPEHDPECPYGDIIVGAHIWGVRQKDKARWPPCHTQVRGDRFPIKLLRQYIEDELRPKWEILEVVYDHWQLEHFGQELSDEGVNAVPFAQTNQRMIPASEDIWNAIVRDGKLWHPNDPVLTRHVMAGVIVETGRGWRLDKQKTKKPIDGLIAVTMSVHRALHYFRTGTPSFKVL